MAIGSSHWIAYIKNRHSKGGWWMLKCCQILIHSFFPGGVTWSRFASNWKSLEGAYTKIDQWKSEYLFCCIFLFLTVIVFIWQNPLTRKSVVIVCDCLKLLVFLHNLVQANESQKVMLYLILEATIMVSSSPTDGSALVGQNNSKIPNHTETFSFFSSSKFFVIVHDISSVLLSCPFQEIQAVKNLAIKLVSNLAHSHSSIVHFKEVLMEIPATRRQMLQVRDVCLWNCGTLYSRFVIVANWNVISSTSS